MSRWRSAPFRRRRRYLSDLVHLNYNLTGSAPRRSISAPSSLLKLFFSSHSPRVIESVAYARCAFDPRKWPNHTSRECDEKPVDAANHHCRICCETDCRGAISRSRKPAEDRATTFARSRPPRWMRAQRPHRRAMQPSCAMSRDSAVRRCHERRLRRRDAVPGRQLRTAGVFDQPCDGRIDRVGERLRIDADHQHDQRE